MIVRTKQETFRADRLVITAGAWAGRVIRQLGIDLEVTPAARQAIASLGYDPSYGARPLKRVIQQRIQNELATEILTDTWCLI